MGTLNYKIIDNFLNIEKFKKLQEILFSENITWYWKKNMVINDDYFFAHCLYNRFVPQSPIFDDFMYDFLNLLKCKSLVTIRANLMLKKEKQYLSEFHVDRSFDCTTAIYYANTCNGYTLLDEDKKIKVESVENRMLIFNSQIKHCAVSQTDFERRIVINFNYF
jgi:hypothetical protein